MINPETGSADTLETGGGAPRRPRAFTLVELLVVILILAALVVIALPRYFQAVYRSRVRGCQSQITIINTSTQAFFARNQVWPTTVEEMCRSTAPAWVISPPLDDVPQCPFGVPYVLVPTLEDGTVGSPPTPGNPQVGVTVNAWGHFDGPWKSALDHRP
jgi:prepilin-type N-terminal cleavage/methylation domain-containing protein